MAKIYQKKIGVPEKPLETKRTKRLRITICALYVLTISFSALPFAQDVSKGGDAQLLTLFNMIFDGFRLGADRNFGVVAIGIVLLAVPIIGFLFESFDKTRLFKCATGIICPIIGISLLCFGISGYISLGAILSMITYLLIFILSIYLMLVITADRHNQIMESDARKPKHNFKIDK